MTDCKMIRKNSRRSLLVFLTLSITGCVAVTELSPGGLNVREISESDAANCRFLQSVSASNTNTLSKDPKADAFARAKNEVALVGGNSLRVLTTKTDIAPSGVGSIFSLSAEAYKCN